MRLVRYGVAGSERPAVVTPDGTAIDLSASVGEIDGDFLSDGGLDRLRTRDLGSLGPVIDLSKTRLGPPIARPRKLVCIGLNYADHAAESGQPLPAEPVTFMKATNTVVGPNDDVLLPIGGLKTDWEIELALVIGRTCRYLGGEPEGEAAIAGYAISNDISERAFQLERGGQWTKGKSAETFNPLGPWLVSKDEIRDVTALDMVLSVNGQVVQRGSTSTMLFTPAYLVWYLSQFMVLEPGDLINTGTPAGVGFGRKPPRYLTAGDVMELAIAGLGKQRQTCRQATMDEPSARADSAIGGTS